MDEAQRSELRELRRRAYGPAPDLDDAELDRLRELEAGPRAAPRTPARHWAATRDGVAGADAGDTEAAGGDDDDLDGPDGPDDEDGPARPRIRRRTTLLWAASVLVAVGAAVAVSSVLGGAAGREVGVVALDPDRPVPDRWDDWYDDAATGVGSFHGLTVIGLVNPEGDSDCVTVVAPRFARGSSPVGGCAAGDFPARGLLTVTGDMPAELRDEFPEGTALEFVLDGGSVRVTAG